VGKIENSDKSLQSGTVERILSSAEKLFAEKGYDGTSIKEICDDARVNIASINYHFESKESLYRHILQRLGNYHVDKLERILTAVSNFNELKVRLEIFLSEIANSMVEKPNLTRIIQREIEYPHFSITNDLFESLFFKPFRKLISFLEEAQKANIIRKDIDLKIASYLLFHHIIHQTRNVNISKQYFGYSFLNNDFRKKWVSETLKIYLEGVMIKK